MISRSSCGHTLRDTARFCTACGNPLARAAERLKGTVSAQADSAVNVVWATAHKPAPATLPTNLGSVADLRVAHDPEQQDGPSTPAVVQLNGVYLAPHAESPAQDPADTAPIDAPAQKPVSDAPFGIDTQIAAPGSRGVYGARGLHGAPGAPGAQARASAAAAQPSAPIRPALPPAPGASPYPPPPLYPEPGASMPRQYDTQAIVAAAGHARAKVGASVGRIPLPHEQVMRALRDGALVALGAWAVGALLIALLDIFTPGNAAPTIWARGGAVILGMTLRASVNLAGGMADSFDNVIPGVDLDDFLRAGGLDMSGSVTFMPLALTAALVAAVVAMAKRAAQASASLTGRDRATRALVTGWPSLSLRPSWPWPCAVRSARTATRSLARTGFTCSAAEH